MNQYPGKVRNLTGIWNGRQRDKVFLLSYTEMVEYLIINSDWNFMIINMHMMNCCAIRRSMRNNNCIRYLI